MSRRPQDHAGRKNYPKKRGCAARPSLYEQRDLHDDSGSVDFTADKMSPDEGDGFASGLNVLRDRKNSRRKVRHDMDQAVVVSEYDTEIITSSGPVPQDVFLSPNFDRAELLEERSEGQPNDLPINLTRLHLGYTNQMRLATCTNPLSPISDSSSSEHYLTSKIPVGHLKTNDSRQRAPHRHNLISIIQNHNRFRTRC